MKVDWMKWIEESSILLLTNLTVVPLGLIFYRQVIEEKDTIEDALNPILSCHFIQRTRQGRILTQRGKHTSVSKQVQPPFDIVSGIPSNEEDSDQILTNIGDDTYEHRIYKNIIFRWLLIIHSGLTSLDNDSHPMDLSCS